MTQISKIFSKYTSKSKYNILCNSKYYDNIIYNLNNTKFQLTTNIDMFANYDLYMVDFDKIDSVHSIYSHYLTPILLMDHDTISDKTKEFCDNKQRIYYRYKEAYPLYVISFDLEQYLYNKNIYDDYIDIKNINTLIIKYINE